MKIELTDETLSHHLEELHVASVKIQHAMEDRDEAIVQALSDGVPARVVAAEVGLTRQRVYQIGKAAYPLLLG